MREESQPQNQEPGMLNSPIIIITVIPSAAGWPHSAICEGRCVVRKAS